MKSWMMVMGLWLLAAMAVGCANVPIDDRGTDESAQVAEQDADDDTLMSTSEALTLLGTNRCTPERQADCDTCAGNCDYLCMQDDGGGRAGGCIGLFCPTRCDACILGCYRTCGKCIPSQLE